MHRTHHAGFSLVELMVTIAIVAILLAAALPSFQGSLRSNRVATATNELIASLSVARSEAIRSTRAAVVCASGDGAACGADWDAGWMVWVDANEDGTRASDEPVVRYVQGRPELSLALASGATQITFDDRGRADTAQAFSLKPVDCPSGTQLQRKLSVTAVGQVNMTPEACP